MCAMFAAMLLIYGHTQYIASQINEPTRLQLAKVRSFIETQYIIPSGYRNLEITDSLIPNPGIETRGPETWQQVYVHGGAKGGVKYYLILWHRYFRTDISTYIATNQVKIKYFNGIVLLQEKFNSPTSVTDNKLIQ